MNHEEKFQEELKNLESRLQAALQGFKPLDGCVTSESVASCEHHGNYRHGYADLMRLNGRPEPTARNVCKARLLG